MTKSNKIWTVAAVVGGFLVYKAYTIFKSITVQFSSFDISNVFSNPQISTRFTIFNPSNYSVTISGIVGTLYYDGKFLANVSTSGQPIPLIQNGLTTVDLKIAPTALSVINFLSEAIQQPTNRQYQFVGSINLYGIPFPINQTLVM